MSTHRPPRSFFVVIAWWLVAGAAPGGLATPAPVDALTASQLGVVINDADPQSVEVGEYYARRRGIPWANVVHVTLPVGQDEITRQELEAARAQVDARIPAHVQALALAWTTPFRVDCLSITTGFAFGFDPAFCAQGCRPTKPSQYFGSTSAAPFHDLGLRPAMLLAGTSVAEAKALIDRGVTSDGTFPSGTAYLLSTSDRARNTRASRYPLVEALGAPVRVERLDANELRDRHDVLFYFTGLAAVTGLETLHFLPGAVADHLTSAGGVLTGHTQMSALRWLDAGATASYGAVVEPCNFPTKFPNPAMLIAHYTRGETLIEAYWKSVAWPGQGVFVGEPLAAPFRSRLR
ncbi:MAG TPA: TIGR03790 family protein [Candidatus Nitrosotalea sp.]|nr:TIGR03790 family protein [Candidatus Nitrosotalea sp.]